MKRLFKTIAGFFSEPLVLHPFLLGIYFILEGFPSISDHMHAFELFIPTMLLLLLIFGLNLIILLITRDKIKSGLLSTVIVVAVLFYTDIFAFIDEKIPALGRTKDVVIIVAFFVIISGWLIIRAKRKLFYFNMFLNALSACYVLYGVVLIGISLGGNAVYHNAALNFQENLACPQPAAAKKTSDLPDIYYIVLDAHTSPASLKKYFNYDDSSFTERLKAKGFYIAEESRSLSSMTLASIASVLNMSNSEKLLDESEEGIVETIEDSVAVKCLQVQSYDIINLSFFRLSGIPRFYQVFFIGEKSHRNFYGLFVRAAIFNIKAKLSMHNVFKSNFKITSRLKEMPLTRQRRPRFIYAHLMVPHAPYCFDRGGNLIPWSKRKSEADMNAYLDQLIFTNTIALDVVEAILSHSKKPPIIIIQGDHGFRRLPTADAEAESLTILNAYYLPHGGNKMLYPSISPYNSFRAIFNYYFGAHYELLKDR